MWTISKETIELQTLIVCYIHIEGNNFLIALFEAQSDVCGEYNRKL